MGRLATTCSCLQRGDELTNTKPAPLARELRDPVLLLALGFGSGLAPRAPGTFGTIVGVGFYAVGTLLAPTVQGLALLGVIALGVPLCGIAARRLGQHDHPAIVWDEIAGFLVTMVGLPAQPAWILAGFALFRLLDITKPWPIRVVERRLPAGWGVMADDLLAGVFACALLHGLHRLPGLT